MKIRFQTDDCPGIMEREPQYKNGPTAMKKPTILGKTVVGEKLTVARGNWVGAGPIAFAYEWLRCKKGERKCAERRGSGETYVLKASDVGRRFEVAVLAVDVN